MPSRHWVTRSEGAEDLTLTPAERAAAKNASQSASQALDAELAEFESLECTTIGSSPGEIVVLGAGLVGSLCAVMLAHKGFKVSLFERYGDIRSIPSAGRSINLSVTSRGLRAIQSLGGSLFKDVLGLATPVLGRIIHLPGEAEEQVLFQRYGKDDSEYNYSISRYELNCYLIEAAERAGVKLHFEHILSETSDFEPEGPEAPVGSVLHFTCNEQRKRLRCECPVVACEGAGSRVRYALRHQGLLEFSEDLLPRTYKEVLFPRPEQHFGTSECSGANGLHIWPRGEHMLMALPNRDGSFTGTIYMDSKGASGSFEALQSKSACQAFMADQYSDAVPLVGGMDALCDQVLRNPEGVLGTVVTSRWAIQARVLLIGDAAHAMVPFFGQGCNCGFEDVLWLSKSLDQHCGGNTTQCTPHAVARCFAALQQARKPNADAICAMALENFVEMRDRTADQHFIALKKVESVLENLFPDKFRSRYAMVCYGGEGNVSYANAYALGPVQDQILQKLLAKAGGSPSADEPLEQLRGRLDMEMAAELIESELVPLHARLQMDLSTVTHLLEPLRPKL